MKSIVRRETNIIGETKQYIYKRIQQHGNHLRNNNEEHSGIVKHAIVSNHIINFNMNDIKILGYENNDHLRKCLENYFIGITEKNVNIQKEFDDIYRKFDELHQLINRALT